MKYHILYDFYGTSVLFKYHIKNLHKLNEAPDNFLC